jgi:hypothetical protein
VSQQILVQQFIGTRFENNILPRFQL